MWLPHPSADQIALVADIAAIVATLGTLTLALVAVSSVATAVRAARFTEINSLFERLEAIREERQRVSTLSIEDIKNGNLTEEDRHSLDRVCRTFDILGLLDRHHLIPAKLINEFYAPPLVLLWDRLEPYVQEQILQRGKAYYWELVEFHRRIQHVYDAHPAHRGKRRWPRFPRSWSWRRRLIERFAVGTPRPKEPE